MDGKLRGFLITVLGAIVLASLYHVMRPEPGTAVQSRAPATERNASEPPVAGARQGPVGEPASTAPITKAPAIPLIRIAGHQRVDGPGVVQVREGDLVRLRFVSDAPVELHLHGYDRVLRLEAGQERLLEFEADKAGRFEYELHGHHGGGHAGLGVIEVYPR